MAPLKAGPIKSPSGQPTKIRSNSFPGGQLLGYITLTVLAALLVMLISGDRFADQLEFLGLYHTKKGVFAECTWENRDTAFCDKSTPVDRDWRSLSHGRQPFSLNR